MNNYFLCYYSFALNVDRSYLSLNQELCNHYNYTIIHACMYAWWGAICVYNYFTIKENNGHVCKIFLSAFDYFKLCHYIIILEHLMIT